MDTSGDENVESSLRTMREMGIQDEELARKALRVREYDLILEQK